MKILWIANNLFQEYFDHKGISAPFTGGWMRSLALQLKEIDPGMELAIASRIKSVKQWEEVKAGGFTFYALPGLLYRDTYDASIEKDWKEIAQRFSPDVVHIHGSEYPHGLAYVNAVGAANVVVSIQGLVSRCARNYTADIRISDMLKNITFYDLFIASTPMKGRKRYIRQGHMEEELLRKINHIIGLLILSQRIISAMRLYGLHFMLTKNGILINAIGIASFLARPTNPSKASTNW